MMVVNKIIFRLIKNSKHLAGQKNETKSTLDYLTNSGSEMSLKGFKVPGNTSYEENKRFVAVWTTGK